MKRFTVTFVVLAATGGCLGVDRDPMDEYSPPRRTTSQSSPYGGPQQPRWNGGNSQTAQGDNADLQKWMNSPSTSRSAAASYGSTYGSTASMTTPPPSKTVAAKPKPKPKIDEDLVKATYTEAPVVKTKTDDAPLPKVPATLPIKATTATKTVEAKTVEAKSAPVNLGVLRLLNSKRITFHYEVKDAGTSGVSNLELWGTKDMRSWKKYDIAQKTPRSLVVEVKDEGLYGFTMVARGKGELSKEPPQIGEPPQVWVAVDLTKPDVKMLGAELNIMASAPSLIIRWTAKDKNFGPRPISLLYAEKLEGPWAPIAANVANTGLHEWAMPACAPGNVYVRVQATDLMGNSGTAQTSLLHIPGRTSAPATVSTKATEPVTSEPPRLATLPSAPIDPMVRPVAATVPNPVVTISSVDGE